MIDSHAHIYSDKYHGQSDKVVETALKSGVKKIYMPNIDSSSVEAMLQLEEDHPGVCHGMMGLHPCSVGKDFEKELAIVEKWLNKRPFVAVGEMGIDLYWDTTFLAQQQQAFRLQAGWAIEKGLPVVIHTRSSMPETLELMEEMNCEGFYGVVHCFTGTLEDARRITNMGFKLGIGGVATFKNGGLNKVLPEISLEHLLLETDSPYLAPVPYRGKRNEPAYLPLVAERVAELLSASVQEVVEATTRNALQMFVHAT